MSLSVIPIPEHIRAQLAANSGFMLLTLNSWRATAIATNELVQHNFALMDKASAEGRAFLGWEIVTAAVEVSEIVATVLLHLRDRHAFPFHAADNKTVGTLFDVLRTDSISKEETQLLLRLRVLPGFNQSAVRVARIHPKLIGTFQLAVKEIAQFWWTHAENARWWRHLPMSLTWDESDVLEVAPGPGREAVRADIEATPDLIETFARMDAKERVLDYSGLRWTDVRVARGVSAVASQLIINVISNTAATEVAASEQRWLLRFLTHGLTRAEQEILAVDGDYTLT